MSAEVDHAARASGRRKNGNARCGKEENRSAEPIPSFSENDFVEPEADSPRAALLALAEANSSGAAGTEHEARWRTLLGEETPRRTTAGVKTAAAGVRTSSGPRARSTSPERGR